MKNLTIWLTISAMTIPFPGMAAQSMPEGATHLTAKQCQDLTAIRNHAPATKEQNRSELAALRMAGYDPRRFDPYYPKDLQAAQQKVDRWYQAECPQAKPQ